MRGAKPRRGSLFYNTAKKTVAALLSALALPAAVTAAEFYFKPDGASGTFETPGNWYVGNAAASAFPGENDQICCTNGLKNITFAESRTTHRVARVTLDKSLYSGSQKYRNQMLFVDLNGGTLCVTNGVVMKASRYEGVACPYFGITNGTLVAKGIACAGGDNNYRGKFEAFGPDTHVVISNGNLSAGGAESVINIGGGASVTWTGMGYPFLQANPGFTPGPKLNLTGAGTTLTCTNGIKLTSLCCFRVADKAEARISGYATGGAYGRQNRNSIGADIGAATVGATLEVDNATFSITNGASFMIAEADRNAQTSHALNVLNNGRFNFSGVTAMNLAYIQNASQYAKKNMIRVYSGGRLSSDGTTVSSEWSGVGAIVVGASGFCIDNGIHVSNGVVSVTHITLGGVAIASNNWLRIEGRTGRVLLNQVYAEAGNLANNRNNPALGLYNNARVEFALGPDGFDNPPIEMTTAKGRIYGQQTEALNQKAQIIVEDQGFARKHGGETITLIKTMNASNRAYFEQLVADATVTASRDLYKGTLSVSEDGKSLLYTAPPKRGLALLVR